MSEVVFRVTLDNNFVGFFMFQRWGEAQKEAASYYNEKHGTNLSWTCFEAKWISPKLYDSYGIDINEIKSKKE